MNPPTRNELLAAAATKPVRHLAQYDGFPGDTTSYTSDRDGDGVFYGDAFDLRATECVRLTFPVEMDRQDVRRIVKKFVAELENEIAQPKVWPEECPF